MNTMSAFRADRRAGANSDARVPVLIWDAPVRVFHWLTVLCFAGAFVTAESERWRLAHVTLGYTMAALIAWRVLWGLFGTRHARFSSFIRGPRAAARYVASLWRGRPEHHAGHNPAGAVAIVALLLVAAVVTASGWLSDQSWGGHAIEELHEGLANGMLALVIMHVLGVALGSVAHRENLVAAMFNGRKAAAPEMSIQRAWRGLAALMLVSVMGFWTWQFLQAPAATPGATAAHRTSAADEDD